MKIEIEHVTNAYNDKYNLHKIKLDYLNLGNNFTETHFKKALRENKNYNDIKEYLYSKDCSDEFVITARGNYSDVSSLIYTIYEVDTLFQ